MQMQQLNAIGLKMEISSVFDMPEAWVGSRFVCSSRRSLAKIIALTQ
jgi:hypothetical protein